MYLYVVQVANYLLRICYIKIPCSFVQLSVTLSTLTDCLQQMVDIWSIHGPLLGELGFKCVLECAARNEYPDPYIICQFVPHLFQGKDGYRINVSDKKVCNWLMNNRLLETKNLRDISQLTWLDGHVKVSVTIN